MRSWTLTVGLLLLGLASGCGGNCAMSLPSGRAISVSSDTLAMSVTSAKDTAMLKLGSTHVVVEPARIVVNQKPVAALPPAAKRISVTRHSGTLHVTADEQPIYTGPL